MRTRFRLSFCIAGILLSAVTASAEIRDIQGWKVHLNPALLEKESATTARALELLDVQLAEIIRVVPAAAVTELQKVPLYFNPEYADVRPRAEYHPDADWLGENGRDPVMAQAVEFTNVRIFEQEVSRMPNFALHELAHAYHHRVLRLSSPILRSALPTKKPRPAGNMTPCNAAMETADQTPRKALTP